MMFCAWSMRELSRPNRVNTIIISYMAETNG
mgnify:CR=1 FL=1